MKRSLGKRIRGEERSDKEGRERVKLRLRVKERG